MENQITFSKLVVYVNKVLENNPEMGEYPVINPVISVETKRKFIEDDLIEESEIRFITIEDSEF